VIAGRGEPSLNPERRQPLPLDPLALRSPCIDVVGSLSVYKSPDCPYPELQAKGKAMSTSTGDDLEQIQDQLQDRMIKSGEWSRSVQADQTFLQGFVRLTKRMIMIILGYSGHYRSS
jgi:hypothetical protein